MLSITRRSFFRQASAAIGGVVAFAVLGKEPAVLANASWTGNCQLVSYEISSGTSGCAIQWGPPDSYHSFIYASSPDYVYSQRCDQYWSSCPKNTTVVQARAATCNSGICSCTKRCS